MSLFEGLEDDPNYFQKMQMKPTIKRLNIPSRGNRSPGVNNPLPEFPTNPLLPLENFASERSSPRYFTPVESVGETSPPSNAAKQLVLNTNYYNHTFLFHMLDY